jgi:hypothetical protein
MTEQELKDCIPGTKLICTSNYVYKNSLTYLSKDSLIEVKSVNRDTITFLDTQTTGTNSLLTEYICIHLEKYPLEVKSGSTDVPRKYNRLSYINND